MPCKTFEATTLFSLNVGLCGGLGVLARWHHESGCGLTSSRLAWGALPRQRRRRQPCKCQNCIGQGKTCHNSCRLFKVNRDFVRLTQGHYLQLNGAVLAAASPLLSEVLTSALSSCDTCHHIQDVVIHSGEKNKHSQSRNMIFERVQAKLQLWYFFNLATQQNVLVLHKLYPWRLVTTENCLVNQDDKNERKVC